MSWIILFLGSACLFHPEATAQKSEIRRQMSSDRGGSFLDIKTLEKGRSFIRRDSTFYLGYMLEGAYLFFRANDELGFNKASKPLQKAFELIENDYDPILRIRSNNYAVYSANYSYHYDYGLIAYFLNRCYQNVELQDKAMEVMYHVRDRNFQVEHGVNSYNTMAWMTHRNRVYTSKQFKFLRNSVKENVDLANKYLDSALLKIVKDAPYNNGLFDPGYLNRQYLSTYHYKAMLYDYKLDIDSASYFYNELIVNDAYSSNNFAEFKLAMGEFEEANQYFLEAENQEGGAEKNTKEYFYMRGSLETYRGHPDKADSLLTDVLNKQGSTPGYGWHCIGLARAQHFEGLTAESQDRNNKAARFQELHIGTTWGQEQYNLAVTSLNYINQLQFEKEYFFEHDEWYFWINPVNWYRWVRYTLEIRHHKMVLASLVAENPEREQVIYTIFSPENLMTFDEVWSVIDGFGNEYFIDIYERLLQNDKRPRLKKYFNYFLGKLYLAEGKEKEAIQYFHRILRDPEINDPYQTLLRARVLEGLAMAGDETESRIQQLYEAYPQLLPFTDLTMTFQLEANAEGTEAGQNIIDDLQNCSINFSNNGSAPLASISITQDSNGVNISYRVDSHGSILREGMLRVENNELDNAGKLLAYRLFGIQKSVIGEQPKPEAAVKEEKPV